MTDSYREQRPLLCDDYSDDEFDVKNYNYQRRNRPLGRSGRARNYAKGAAAVITRWPDNCSTSVAYWWLGASMIAITIFVIYNSVLIFGMIPTTDMKPSKYRIFNNEFKPNDQNVVMPDVYMHLIINNISDVVLNKYLPYATRLSKRHPSFKYKFLIVLNDTLKYFHDYKDEERNEIAFNFLWVNEKVNKKISIKYNISVECISLTEYLNDSPIKKFWKHLPPHLIDFLVRSVSIWEKGGIAFNPNILIPNFYNPHYIDKLYDILNIYGNSSSKSERKIKAKLYPGVTTRRPNNIQDIINGLGTNDDNVSKFDLSEAENNNHGVISNTENTLKFKRAFKHNSQAENNIKNNLKENNKIYDKEIKLNKTKHNNSNSMNITDATENILPLFLKYLFDNKPKMESSDFVHLEMSRNDTSLYNTPISFNQNESLPVENILKLPRKRDEYNGSIEISKKPLSINMYDYAPELSIDIKGNIIASKTACHAFLGTMFSNVIQHTEEETLTDFIISEVSLFCNGLLASCAGVNVILV